MLCSRDELLTVAPTSDRNSTGIADGREGSELKASSNAHDLMVQGSVSGSASRLR